MANAFHGGLQAAVACNDDDFDIGVIVLDILQEVDALAIGELLVQRNEVDGFMTQDVECRLRVVGRANVEEGPQDDFERITRSGLVIDDKNRRFCLGYVLRNCCVHHIHIPPTT